MFKTRTKTSDFEHFQNSLKRKLKMKLRMINDGKGGKTYAQPTKAQSTAIVKEANAVMSAIKVVDEANKLSIQRETFEKEEYARSNKALYAILSSIYTLFKKAVEDKCIKEAVKAMSVQLKARGVKVQSNSPALTVFVRFVFNSDRKRAYNYASTLMAAVQAEVEPSKLADFIEGKNGVEECKKQYKMKDETKQRVQAVAAASIEVVSALKSMPCASSITLPNSNVEFSEGAEFAFIVARSNGKGNFELLRVIPKSTKTMQSAAVKELAKHLIEQATAVAADAKSKKVKSATAKAVVSMTAKTAAKMTMKEMEAA